MGFLDRFKRQEQSPQATPPPIPPTPPPIPAAALLTFHSTGCFEIAACPGDDALKHLDRLRAEGRSAGFTAVILGARMLGAEDETNSSVDVRELAKGLGQALESAEWSVQDCLRKAADVDVEKWLKQRVESDPDAYLAKPGDWPSEVMAGGKISVHLDVVSGMPKPVAFIAKIPTPHVWEIPAYLGIGGVNEIPDDEVLTAFSKRWHERYGAELVAIDYDTMEFLVANPPATKEAALELAQEQYLVCEDLVVHDHISGDGNVSVHAATLLNAKYWCFWWD